MTQTSPTQVEFLPASAQKFNAQPSVFYVFESLRSSFKVTFPYQHILIVPFAKVLTENEGLDSYQKECVTICRR